MFRERSKKTATFSPYQSVHISPYHIQSISAKMSVSSYQPLILTADEAAVLQLLQQLYPAANYVEFCEMGDLGLVPQNEHMDHRTG